MARAPWLFGVCLSSVLSSHVVLLANASMQTAQTYSVSVTCLLYPGFVTRAACSRCHTTRVCKHGLVASLSCMARFTHHTCMAQSSAFGDTGCVTVLQAAPRGIPLWWASQQSSCWPTLQRPSAWNGTRSAWWVTGWTQTSSLVRMAVSAPCLSSQVCSHHLCICLG